MSEPSSRSSRHSNPVEYAAVYGSSEAPWADYYTDKRRIDRCVYVLHIPEIRRLKIGYTRGNVAKRVQAIRRANPELAGFAFDILGTINGGRCMERVIHDRYKTHRISGEWFDDAIIDDIQGLIVEDGEWFSEIT